MSISEENSAVEEKKRSVFTKIITKRWGDSITPFPMKEPSKMEPYSDNNEKERMGATGRR